MSRGFYFETRNGNKYFYNDDNGSVAVAHSMMNNYEDNSNHKDKLADSPINKSKFINSLISNHLSQNGYRQLILISSEQCNMRCKYCVNSGNYIGFRTHKDILMDWNIAETSIRKYFIGFSNTKQINPQIQPNITFYGGEPLLNTDLIKHVVNFVKQVYYKKTNFFITTNGTLLTEKIIDFLYENEFNITVSLDGPKSEHDRLRVFWNASGSFDLIWENLQRIRRKYPDYYQKYCSIISVFDIGTNLKDTKSFFEKHREELPKLRHVSSVASSFTDWYRRYSAEQYRIFKENYDYCKNNFRQQLNRGEQPSDFLNLLIGAEYQSIMNRQQNVWNQDVLIPYTATCIPGQKIAVDPSGNFHCCEKINNQFPIGNIEEGISTESIIALLKAYYSQILVNCVDCPITRLCSFCYAILAEKGKFKKDPSNLCDIQFDNVKRRFSELWTMFEMGIQESQILLKTIISVQDI